MATKNGNMSKINNRLRGVSTMALYDYVVKENPWFGEKINALQANVFAANGFLMLDKLPQDLQSEFCSLTAQFMLSEVIKENAENVFPESAIEFDNKPFGKYDQRIAVKKRPAMDPIYPGTPGTPVLDVLTPEKQEYIEVFAATDDRRFQEKITISELEFMECVTSPEKFSELMAAKVDIMIATYNEWMYEGFISAFTAAITDDNLKDSQVKELAHWLDDANMTTAQLKDILFEINKLGAYMENVTSTDEFNVAGYSHKPIRDEYTLYVRSGMKDKLELLVAEIFHDTNVRFKFKIEELLDFDNGIPYSDTSENKVRVYPIWKNNGEPTGYFIGENYGDAASSVLTKKTVTINGSTVIVGYQANVNSIATIADIGGTAKKSEIVFEQACGDICAVLAQDGFLLNYTKVALNVRDFPVAPAYFVNKYMSAIGAVKVNKLKDIVVFKKKAAESNESNDNSESENTVTP